MEQLERVVKGIVEVSAEAIDEATKRQASLTKPQGSLGLLEQIGIQLAGIYRACPPPVPSKPIVGVFAGDHGVWAQGVSPWPQEVTVSMLANMASGGAAINVLSSQLGAKVTITDVGVKLDHPAWDNVRARNVARGTRDLFVEPAMTREQALEALQVGVVTADEAIAAGADVLLTGEMGIGNTTPSAALISVFTGASVAEVTGRGTGIDDQALAHKIDVIEQALDKHQPSAQDPVDALAAVGGLEIAAIAGFILGGARRGVPVILDGVIASAAACVAVGIAPAARGYLIAGHAGAEPGISAALNHLGLSALVDLGLRLGEGSGAVLALPLVQCSARILRDMATFADAGIDEA